jgi:DnaJ family protein C protein 27
MREAPSVKLISLGDSRTGKSCLIKRFCEKRFVSKYMQTIGIDYGTTQVYAKKSDGKTQPLKLHIFDTGGHDCFKQIREEFYVDSQAVLMTFSLDNKQSFTNLKDYWMKELESNIDDHRRENLIIVIVATKSDSTSLEVKSDEARTWVESKAGWKYFETSSQSGQNVAECFDYIFTEQLLLIENDGVRAVKKAAFTPEEVKIVKQILNGKDDWSRMALHPSASKADLKKRFHYYSRLIHPDKSKVPGCTEAFAQLSKVRENLERQVK